MDKKVTLSLSIATMAYFSKKFTLLSYDYDTFQPKIGQCANAQQSKCRPPSFDFILGFFRKKLAPLWGKALRAFARQLFDRCCRSFSAGKSNQALLTLVGSQMKIEKWCITTILRWQFLLEAWSYMKGPSKLNAPISHTQFSGLR